MLEHGISFYSQPPLMEDADILCVVGGDGTLFKYAPYALEMGIPIWFVNAGSVGFLAEDSNDIADLDARVAAIAEGKYTLEQRDLLEAHVGDQTYVALNDVCLMRDTRQLQTVTLDVHLGREQVAAYRGDGAIVCTAMGSTGYALSAGAPIMSPTATGMMFVPICPHSLLSKPVIFGPQDAVALHCKEGAALFVDGVHMCDRPDLAVTVRMAPTKVRFVRTRAPEFFARIGKKLL